MPECQFLGVEKLPLQAELFAKPTVESKIAVLLVHDYRITEFGEMETDLVQPTGIYFYTHQGRIRKPPADPVMGQRMHWSSFSARQWKIDFSLVPKPAFNQAEIFLFDLALFEAGRQFLDGHGILRNQQ